MTPASIVRWILAFAVTTLALADGVLHVALDFVLFEGKLWGSAMPGPPPGPPPAGGPGPAGPPPAAATNQLLQALDISRITSLPLNDLFLLNAIGYVVLSLAFLSGRRWLGSWRGLVDVVLIGYTAASIVGWLDIGRPNPHGLGYLSKAIEFVLIGVLAAHAWVVLRPAARAIGSPEGSAEVVRRLRRVVRQVVGEEIGHRKRGWICSAHQPRSSCDPC